MANEQAQAGQPPIQGDRGKNAYFGSNRSHGRGVYTGGKARIDRKLVKGLMAGGLGPAATARELGVSRMSIYLFCGRPLGS